MTALQAEAESAYLTRVYGDRQLYNMVGADEGKTATYEIALIISLQWPGFYTIVNIEKQRWSHLYLGMGIKANQTFIPQKPKDFLKEANDLTEVKEPHDAPKVEKEEGEEEQEGNEEQADELSNPDEDQ